MINRFKWLEVSRDTRTNIVLYLKDFTDFPEFKKSGHIEVSGNKVVCDGFTDQDLCKLTPELLRAALDESTLKDRGVDPQDVYALFYELVARLEMPPVELKEQPVAKVEEVNPIEMIENLDKQSEAIHEIVKKDIIKTLKKQNYEKKL